MSKDISKKTKNSLYWNVSLKIPYEVFRFVTSIIIARILEPKDFGVVSIATMAIYYSNTITSFGFNQALVQRKDITEKHINSVFTFDLTISIFLAGMFYFMAPAIASFFNSPESMNVIRVLSIVFVLTTLHDMPYTLLRRNINFKTISLIDTVKEIFMTLVTLSLAMLGFKYWAIVFGHLIPLFFVTFYLLYKVGWRPRISYHHASLKELFNFGIWSFINTQIYFFSTRMDRIIIGRALTPSILGIYDKAKSLSQMPSESIGTNINTVLFSSFSRSQQSAEELKNILRKALVITSAINFPIYLGLYVVAPHFVLVLLGEKWRQMIIPLQIMCIGGFFTSFNGLFSAFNFSTGNYQKHNIRVIIATCFLIAESIFLVRFGIEAVAAGVAIYSLIVFYLTYDIISKKFNILWKELIACISPTILACAIMFLVIKAYYTAFSEEITFINLFSVVIIGAMTYIISMVLIPTSILKNIRTSIYSDFEKGWTKFKNIFRA